MNPQTSFIKGLSICLIVVGIGLPLSNSFVRYLPPEYRKHSFSDFLAAYRLAWTNVQNKVDDIEHLEESNDKLRADNAELKLRYESFQFGCGEKKAAHLTQDFELKLRQKTGSPVGRVLASLGYQVPSRLLPAQLYDLGVDYLKAREDEKAAAIFSSLTEMSDDDSYRTSENLLIAGISWYRIENFSLAEYYFDEVLKTAEVKSNLEYQAQARLWKAVIAQKFNKELKAQFWLQELVDHHPHSRETEWVNDPKATEHAER